LTSAESPFLSGAPFLTFSQLIHMAKTLIKHGEVSITIAHTTRLVSNRYGYKHEKERLLPVALHQREVAGTYTVISPQAKEYGNDHPEVRSIYTDNSGDTPVTYFDAEADAKLIEAAGISEAPNWQTLIHKQHHVCEDSSSEDDM
jgi:hypothetical protein